MTINEVIYNWAYIPPARTQTTHLIIHHAAAVTAAPQDIHRWHLAEGWAGFAYHYLVRKDGGIYRGRRENWQGGHTTGMNGVSIGICFEGNFELEYMPDAQLAAGRELVADIVKRYPGISVGRHKDFNATACPGKNFPYAEMLAFSTTATEANDGYGEFLAHMRRYVSEQAAAEPSEWAEAAAGRAVERGLFIGDGQGNFAWQGTVTRQELAVVLDRLYAAAPRDIN